MWSKHIFEWPARPRTREQPATDRAPADAKYNPERTSIHVEESRKDAINIYIFPGQYDLFFKAQINYFFQVIFKIKYFFQVIFLPDSCHSLERESINSNWKWSGSQGKLNFTKVFWFLRSYVRNLTWTASASLDQFIFSLFHPFFTGFPCCIFILSEIFSSLVVP